MNIGGCRLAVFVSRETVMSDRIVPYLDAARLTALPTVALERASLRFGMPIVLDAIFEIAEQCSQEASGHLINDLQ